MLQAPGLMLSVVQGTGGAGERDGGVGSEEVRVVVADSNVYWRGRDRQAS